ncbi:MAG: hypothetical protein NC184_03775 [Roseburia sp.]|nr:hypothetical protein [Roseburia sp.]
MLHKLSAREAERYIDFAYALALDRSRSGFPSYNDGIKTGSDFADELARLASGENSELLLFECDGKALGLLGYFCLPDDKYIQTTIMDIADKTEVALSEFIEYMRRRFCGYELNIGVTAENVAARRSLAENGFECVENDYCCCLLFDNYVAAGESDCVRAVTAENFGDFSTLHDGVQMYWTSERILRALSDWRAFVYYDGGAPVGAIYALGADMPEIFGVDFSAGFDADVYRALLTKLLNSFKASGAKHMTYFVEERERAVAERLGFCEVGEYFCFAAVL